MTLSTFIHDLPGFEEFKRVWAGSDSLKAYVFSEDVEAIGIWLDFNGYRAALQEWKDIANKWAVFRAR